MTDNALSRRLREIREAGAPASPEPDAQPDVAEVGSLRERLASGEQSTAEAAVAEPSGAPEGEAPAESYLLFEAGVAEPLHVAGSFLDAADAAFELIDERQPEALEIVRFRGGEREQLWSFEGNATDLPLEPPAPS
jgi:hypothetical protein